MAARSSVIPWLLLGGLILIGGGVAYMAARGIRNNNPGNIIDDGRTNWRGLDDPRNDGRYLRFIAPEWGIRALARILWSYYHRHGLRTVRAIIHRYAPATENDTQAYIAHVAQQMGVQPDQVLPWDRGTLRRLIEAIIKHENGIQPYSTATIDKGIDLAGVV